MARRRPPNPFAPLSQKQLTLMARRYAQAQFGPVLSQINASYRQRAAAGASSIQRGTEALAASLAPVQQQTHDIYAQAQSAQSAIDNAIAAKLTAAGKSSAANVNSQLDAAGIPRAAAPDLAQMGAGAAAASFGSGSAAQSALVARGAAAENYAGTLPALARLGGAQRGQDLALQLEHGRQQDVGALQAKIPGAVAQIEQDLANRELQKGIAVQSGLVNQQKLGLAQAKMTEQSTQFAAKHNLDVAKARVDALYKQANLKISQGRLQIAARNEARLERTKSGKKGGYTPTQLDKIHNNALEAAKVYKHGSPNPYYNPNADKKHPPYHKGVPDTKQTIGGGMSAEQAFRTLVNHNVPPSMADQIVGMVYGKWKTKGTNKRLGL